MTTPDDTNALVGSAIGNYQVLSLLGSGAMGEVFLGEHPRIGRKVAIKVLVAALSVNPEMAQRFVSEAKAVNTINHPNIIQIFDFGELADGRLYFTMEHLQGRELTHHIGEKAPLPLGEVKELMEQMSGALDAAHEVGIVHRDLKPDNIFLAEGRQGPAVKILDFGIAKLIEPGLADGSATTSGVIMGTPLYMSPEQAAGQTRDISPRSDVYALGVILYQLLSGQLPIQAASTAEVLYRHMAEPPIPLLEVAADLPPDVADVVERSLAKDPADRQQSAGELYQQFVQACGDFPASATATVAPGAVAVGGGVSSLSAKPASSTLGASASQAMSGATETASARGTSTATKLLAGVGAAALAVLVFLFATGRLGGSEPKPARSDAPPVASPMTPAPREAPRPRAVARPASPPSVALHRISVEARSSRTRIEVSIAGQVVHQKRKPPFSLEAKQGERVTLTARRSGYDEHTESFVVSADRQVRFALERRRPGRRPRVAPRVAPRVVVAPARPRPRTILVRARPRPRPVMRPRPRPRAMDNIDVGTERPMF